MKKPSLAKYISTCCKQDSGIHNQHKYNDKYNLKDINL